MSSENNKKNIASQREQEEEQTNHDRQYAKKSKRKIQGVPQSQTAALPRH